MRRTVPKRRDNNTTDLLLADSGSILLLRWNIKYYTDGCPKSFDNKQIQAIFHRTSLSISFSRSIVAGDYSVELSVIVIIIIMMYNCCETRNTELILLSVTRPNRELVSVTRPNESKSMIGRRCSMYVCLDEKTFDGFFSKFLAVRYVVLE